MAEIQPTDTPVAADPIADAISFLETAADIPAEAEDVEAKAPEPDDKGIGTSPSEPLKADEPIKAPEPVKVEERLTPQMEALARKDRAILEKRQALKAERDSFEAERQKWQAERVEVEKVELLARTDLVSLAERVKLSPQERQKLAIELWESAQPGDKQTPQYREQVKQRTQLTETQERLAKLEAENKAAQERAAQAEQQAKAVQLGETIVTSVSSIVENYLDKAPYTAALLKHDRAGVREDLWALAQAHWESDPDSELTPAMLIERYEPLLAAKFEPIKKVLGLAQQTPKNASPSEAEKKPSTTLSASRTAAPTKARPEPKSDEDLIRDAAAFLESRQ